MSKIFVRWQSVDVQTPEGTSRVDGLGVQVENLTSEERQEGDYGSSDLPRKFIARITGAGTRVRPRDVIVFEGEDHVVQSVIEDHRMGRVEIVALGSAG